MAGIKELVARLGRLEDTWPDAPVLTSDEVTARILWLQERYQRGELTDDERERLRRINGLLESGCLRLPTAFLTLCADTGSPDRHQPPPQPAPLPAPSPTSTETQASLNQSHWDSLRLQVSLIPRSHTAFSYFFLK